MSKEIDMYSKKILGRRFKPQLTSSDEITFMENYNEYQDLVKAKRNIELTVLVLMSISEHALSTAIRILDNEDFDNPDCIVVFETVKKMFKEGMSFNIDSFVLFSSNQKVQLPPGTVFDLKEKLKLFDKVDSIDVKKYCILLKESSMHSKALQAFMATFLKIRSKSQAEDIFEWISKARTALDEILSIKASEIKSLNQLALIARDEEKREQSQNKLSSISTGYKTIDYRTGGFQKTDLILIAGRPGMGKTAFIVSMLKAYVTTQAIPFVFFSLEMSFTQLLKRLYSQIYQVDLNLITASKWSKPQQERYFEFCTALPEYSYIIDNCFNINDIEIQSEILVKKGAKVIVIDYLQLITGGEGSNQTYIIGDISRRLKMLAKKLNVPVIALSQLSRVQKKDPKKKPSIEDYYPDLEDLRDSGSLEQDADMVGFLVRPDYYADKIKDLPVGSENHVFFICKKFRGGKTFNQEMKWVGSFAQIEDDQTTIDQITIRENEKNLASIEGNGPAPF